MMTVLALVGAILLAYLLHSRALSAAEQARKREAYHRRLATLRAWEAAQNTYKENPDGRSD